MTLAYINSETGFSLFFSPPPPLSHWRKMSQSNVSDSSGQPFTSIFIQVNASCSTFAHHSRNWHHTIANRLTRFCKVRLAIFDAHYGRLYFATEWDILSSLLNWTKKMQVLIYFVFRKEMLCSSYCELCNSQWYDPCYYSNKVYAWVARDHK